MFAASRIASKRGSTYLREQYIEIFPMQLSPQNLLVLVDFHDLDTADTHLVRSIIDHHVVT